VKWLEAGDKPIYIGFGSLVRSVGLALYFQQFFILLDLTNDTAWTIALKYSGYSGNFIFGLHFCM
jgi:hypothetical protein